MRGNLKDQDKENQVEKPFPIAAKFLVGGLAGTTAAFLVHPLDFLKTRMQMSETKSTAIEKINEIYRNEGCFGFYNGGTACLLKQSVYTTIRFGIYMNLFEFFDQEKPSFLIKILTGTFAGICSGFLSTPLDICLVRMMCDGCKPKDLQFKYKNPIEALIRISREEKGIRGLYRGAIPTTLRAGIIGIGLGTYSQIKETLRYYFDFEEGLKLQLTASMLSGLLSAFGTLPFDFLKTRAQNKTGQNKIIGIKILKDVVKEEGVFAFWKGFTPYYVRIMPITVLTFVFVEQLSYYYGVYVLENKEPKSNL